MSSSIIPLLESWLLGWSFHALDVLGRSGGISLGVKNRTIELNRVWGGIEHLGADIYSTTLEAEYIIINVYGPFHDMADFWRKLLSSSIIQKDNIILGGDLNFSIGFIESWGQ